MQQNAVKVEVDGERLFVYSPYNNMFVSGARDLKGKFERHSRGNRWVFDSRDERRVRELLVDTYGTDGSGPAETVDVRVRPSEWADSKEFCLFGRSIAWRPGRDARVRLGDGVVIVEGSGFSDRGGSVKNPRLEPFADTVLEVRDVPRAFFESGGNYHGDVADGSVVLVERDEHDDREGQVVRLLDKLAELRAQQREVRRQLADLGASDLVDPDDEEAQ